MQRCRIWRAQQNQRKQRKNACNQARSTYNRENNPHLWTIHIYITLTTQAT